MRLEIDWTRCDGHGLCARLLPERIGLDDAGFPVLGDRTVDTDDLAHARRAVSACPRLALRLEQAPSPATR
ncbi:ferredoxin [Nocardioides agariphilus]|jgi:ferredoxin|uniref:Ferredoxin n=1 Tax=Nocardioides agariphilus TaxID=433664 RepID=A0A930VL55_9ACTN|nr:ferredoxin [Nocardioides agariphilus]MBF4766868.1 ferredoxin [Nocardioides agariphilus]